MELKSIVGSGNRKMECQTKKNGGRVMNKFLAFESFASSKLLNPPSYPLPPSSVGINYFGQGKEYYIGEHGIIPPPPQLSCLDPRVEKAEEDPSKVSRCDQNHSPRYNNPNIKKSKHYYSLLRKERDPKEFGDGAHRPRKPGKVVMPTAESHLSHTLKDKSGRGSRPEEINTSTH